MTLTVDATRTGSGGGQPLAVTATVAFGDGSTGSTAACGAPAVIDHVYARAGHYQPLVTAASICEPAEAPDLSFSSVQVLVFPSAPAVSAGWPTCSTFQLQLGGRNLGGAMGTVGDLVSLLNTSSRGCQLEGYPGLRLVAPDGGLLSTSVQAAQDGSMMFPASRPHRVALEPGAVASFDLDYNDNPSGAANNEPYSVACPTAVALRVILPGTTQYGTATLGLAPCDGLIRVSPVVPGGSGFGF